MSAARPLPDEHKSALDRARRLEVLWIACLVSIVVALYFSLGGSQA